MQDRIASKCVRPGELLPGIAQGQTHPSVRLLIARRSFSPLLLEDSIPFRAKRLLPGDFRSVALG